MCQLFVLRRLFLLTVLFVPLAFSACATTQGGQGKGSTGWRDNPEMALVRKAGDRAPVIVVLRPEKWAESLPARDALATLLSIEGRDGRRLASALRASSPWTALEAALDNSPHKAPWPPGTDPPGWDPKRPLVLALAEPFSLAGPIRIGQLGQSLFSPAESRPPIGVRHRLLVPATDPKALSASLRGLVLQLALPKERPGSPGLYWGNNEGALITEGADHVSIDLFFLAGTDLRDDPSLEKYLRVGVPEMAELPGTPAFFHLQHGKDVVAAYVRLAKFREFAFADSARKMIRALSWASPEDRGRLISQGLVEMIGGYSLLSPESLEVEDVALGISADLHVSSVHSLSERAASAWAAGKAGGLSTPRPLKAGLFEGSLRVDLRTLFSQIEPPPAYQGRKLREVTDRIQECGSACIFYTGLGQPLGFLKIMLSDPRMMRQLPPDVLGLLPKGLQITVQELSKERPPIIGALAVSFDKGRDLSFIPRLVGPLKERLGLLDETRSGTQETYLLSTVSKPQEFLGELGGKDGDAILSLSLDLLRLRASPAFSSRERNEINTRTAGLSGVRFQLGLQGRALFMEYAVERGQRQGLHLPGVLAKAPKSWKNPALVDPQHREASRCLETAIDGVREILRVMVVTTEEAQQTVVHNGTAELDQPLRCAEKSTHKEIQAEAQSLRQFAAELAKRQPAKP